MLDKQSTLLLRQLLDTVSETEMMIEQYRQQICSDPEFAPYTAFCRIDSDGRERICSHDIQNFLHSNNLAGISVGECAGIIKNFDTDKDN